MSVQAGCLRRRATACADWIAVPLVETVGMAVNLRIEWVGLSNSSFSSHVDFYCTKAYTTIRALRMLGNSVKGLDSKNRTKVFKAAALPVLTYGAALYWKRGGLRVLGLLKKMKKVQSYVARWTVNAFRTTPGGAASSLAGFPPLAAELDKLVAKAH